QYAPRTGLDGYKNGRRCVLEVSSRCSVAWTGCGFSVDGISNRYCTASDWNNSVGQCCRARDERKQCWFSSTRYQLGEGNSSGLQAHQRGAGETAERLGAPARQAALIRHLRSNHRLVSERRGLSLDRKIERGCPELATV